MANLSDTVQLLGLFADPSRVRLLALLAREELTVAELTEITGLSQSRVSAHLARLREAGLLRPRPVGPATFYALTDGAMPEAPRELWRLIAAHTDDVVLQEDRNRTAAVLNARNGESSWPESVAGEMERHYSPGRTWEALVHGLSALVSLGAVLDVGSGDGTLASLLAPRAERVVCVDRSDTVIRAAKRRLAGIDNADFVVADMHALPFADDTFEQVLLFNVLTYSDRPPQALAEAARVLEPGGTLVVVTLGHHRHLDTAARWGHVQPGFRPARLRSILEKAGLDVMACHVVARERRVPHFETLVARAEKTAPEKLKRQRKKSVAV